MKQKTCEVVLGPQRGGFTAPLGGEQRELQSRIFEGWYTYLGLEQAVNGGLPDELLPLFIMRAASRKEAEELMALAPSCVRAEVHYPRPAIDDRWWRVASIAAVGFGTMALALAGGPDKLNIVAPAMAVAMAGLWKLSEVEASFEFTPRHSTRPWRVSF